MNTTTTNQTPATGALRELLNAASEWHLAAGLIEKGHAEVRYTRAIGALAADMAIPDAHAAIMGLGWALVDWAPPPPLPAFLARGHGAGCHHRFGPDGVCASCGEVAR